MAAEIPNVRLRLASNPESVALVRQVVSGLAEAIGLDPLELNEMNTVVSEAATTRSARAISTSRRPSRRVSCGCASGRCARATGARSSTTRRSRDSVPSWRD
jgi:CO/xanthine dehydrogenase Mo-binding subunit